MKHLKAILKETLFSSCDSFQSCVWLNIYASSKARLYARKETCGQYNHTYVPHNQHANHLRVAWQNLLSTYIFAACECQV